MIKNLTFITWWKKRFFTRQSVSDVQLSEILARLKIEELCALYARGMDRLDPEIMKSVFLPNARYKHLHHFDGLATDFIDYAVQLLRKQGPMSHYICNKLVRIKGNNAVGEWYCISFKRGQEIECSTDSITGVRVLDDYKRRHGEWKIAGRRVIYDWNLDIPTNENWGGASFDGGDRDIMNNDLGRAGIDDPSYAHMSKLD